jgi:hypothetical protein
MYELMFRTAGLRYSLIPRETVLALKQGKNQ